MTGPDRHLAAKLAVICLAMFAFGFALVPLYDVLCRLTGIGGKTSTASAETVAAAVIDPDRTVRVEFLASVARGAPWDFAPEISYLDVHPGEVYETHYVARNRTEATLVAQAVPSVAPSQAAKHFQKTECFCFTSQQFGPHEERELKLAFMVSPDLPPHVDRLSLAYTYFSAPN